MMDDHAPHAACEPHMPTAGQVAMLEFSHPEQAVLGDPALQMVEISANINRTATVHAISAEHYLRPNQGYSYFKSNVNVSSIQLQIWCRYTDNTL